MQYVIGVTGWRWWLKHLEIPTVWGTVCGWVPAKFCAFHCAKVPRYCITLRGTRMWYWAKGAFPLERNSVIHFSIFESRFKNRSKSQFCLRFFGNSAIICCALCVWTLSKRENQKVTSHNSTRVRMHPPQHHTLLVKA